ncbi:MAG: hypothetical protein NTX22_09490 [Ignavibacteriales bacterium]|nr:hypothetical protein [Ignavibacteriales bacterium]
MIREQKENSPELKTFIRDHKDLFWYIKEEAKERISLEFLIETILNYGTLNDVKKMFELIGFKKTAEIFFKQSSRERNSYLPKVKNYFTLYFNRHAQRNTSTITS